MATGERDVPHGVSELGTSLGLTIRSRTAGEALSPSKFGTLTKERPLLLEVGCRTRCFAGGHNPKSHYLSIF